MESDHRANEVTLFFGKKGGGKTTLARKVARTYPRKVYVDPMFEITDGAIARNFAEAVYYIEQRRKGEQPGSRLHSFSVVLRTLDIQEEYRMIQLLTHGDPNSPLLPNTLVFIDEMDRLCSPNSIPEPMHRLANYGRHFGISVIGIARSPKGIHPDFRRAADTIYVGQMNEPADIDYLNEYTGSDFCARARTLQGYDFLRWPEPPPP